ncbi:MAG: transcription termination/antitermination protein NusG [Alphaproteobacteria bacterium]|nr:transcription termination/antitermination protein NusG [Alphaproteobacteria bacterium]MBQ3945323.1 transcription termination/antitermination protein NusG [Alphaproteobacteria bacterium]
MAEQKARWYIVHAYSGSENRVAQLIRENAEKKGLSEFFEEILVPTEEVTEIKNGQRVNVDRKYLPGYVLVKMIMNDETWYLVRNVPRVSGILGSKGKPSPISEAEVKKIMEQLKTSAEAPRVADVYEIGDQVKITDGAFASFSGFVEEIEDDKQKLKVSVMIFGRATPVELEYTQVEKM